MRVAIDLTPLQTGHRNRGIGFYTRRLVDTLQKVDKKNEYVFFSQGQNIPNADLIHYPYFDLFFLTLPIVKRHPAVVTIFDVIPLIFWKEFTSGIRAIIKLKIQKFLLKRNVDWVITISQNSKKDIERYLGIPSEKINVTYLAADSLFQPVTKSDLLIKVKDKYNLPQTFLLYVGDVNYNKNLPRLFAALAKIEIPLVMVGAAAKNEQLREIKDLMKLVANLGIEKKITRLGFVPESDLAAIYNLAICYIQPSLYEGFGLPVLEAMACGCPVICAATSSLPEIGGKAAIYIDPDSVDSIVEKVNQVLNFYKHDVAKYKALKLDCLNQAKKFSWQKTTEETIAVYKKVLS